MSKDVKNNFILTAKNQKDLEIISTYSQDSIVAIKDVIFLGKNRIFIMIINRFMWESVEKDTYNKNKRIRCAIKFEDVLKVKSKRINQKNKNKNLECLAIKCYEVLNKNYHINFFFSGGGVISLITESIEVVMNDLGESWNVKPIPQHKI